jgi:hypothetical protein
VFNFCLTLMYFWLGNVSGVGKVRLGLTRTLSHTTPVAPSSQSHEGSLFADG